MTIPITHLEQAINFWRARLPASADEHRLCAPAAALAEPYALMILGRQQEIDAEALSPPARAAYDEWLAGTAGPP